MDCRTFHNQLEDYLEGGLDFSGRFGMERHTEQCYLCGMEVKSAQELSGLAHEIKKVSAPRNFEATVLARIHSGNAHPPYRWRRWYRRLWFHPWCLPSMRTLAVGAAGFVVLALGMFLSVDFLHNWRYPDTPATRTTPENQASPGIVRPVTNSISDFRTSSRRVSLGKISPLPRELNPDKNDPVFELIEPIDSEYVEYLIPVPGNGQYIMRLPETIQMQYGQPSEEHFIRNVSH